MNTGDVILFIIDEYRNCQVNSSYILCSKILFTLDASLPLLIIIYLFLICKPYELSFMMDSNRMSFVSLQTAKEWQ